MLYSICLECLYVRLYLYEVYMSHMAGALHLAPAEQPLSHTPALISKTFAHCNAMPLGLQLPQHPDLTSIKIQTNQYQSQYLSQ